MCVEFDIPAILASQAGRDSDNLTQEVRRAISIFLYEHRHFSLGKACEIGGLSQWEFMELS